MDEVMAFVKVVAIIITFGTAIYCSWIGQYDKGTYYLLMFGLIMLLDK